MTLEHLHNLAEYEGHLEITPQLLQKVEALGPVDAL